MKPRISLPSTGGLGHTLAGLRQRQNNLERAPVVVTAKQISTATPKKQPIKAGPTPLIEQDTLIYAMILSVFANPTLGPGSQGRIYNIEAESPTYGILKPQSVIPSGHTWHDQDGSTNVADILDSISNHNGDDSFYAEWLYDGGPVGDGNFAGNLDGILGTPLGRTGFPIPFGQLTIRVRAQKILGALFNHMSLLVETAYSSGWSVGIEISGSIVTYEFISPP